MLSVSLDTNSVIFNNYSCVQNLEILEAFNLTVNSSLPYDLNAYMPMEILNSDGNSTIPLSTFNIKESTQSVYQQFTGTTNKVILKDGCLDGNGNTHAIDLKLSTNQAHKADIYKTVIRFKILQKWKKRL